MEHDLSSGATDAIDAQFASPSYTKIITKVHSTSGRLAVSTQR